MGLLSLAKYFMTEPQGVEKSEFRSIFVLSISKQEQLLKCCTQNHKAQ